MDKIDGYMAKRDGVRVIVMQDPDYVGSWRGMLRTAIDMLEEEYKEESCH